MKYCRSLLENHSYLNKLKLIWNNFTYSLIKRIEVTFPPRLVEPRLNFLRPLYRYGQSPFTSVAIFTTKKFVQPSVTVCMLVLAIHRVRCRGRKIRSLPKANNSALKVSLRLKRSLPLFPPSWLKNTHEEEILISAAMFAYNVFVSAPIIGTWALGKGLTNQSKVSFVFIVSAVNQSEAV